MKCPFCNSSETTVKDSRHVENKATVRRRRYCNSCGYKFSTYERIQLRELFVIKRSGFRKPFDRTKIINSITTAVRKRRVIAEQVESIADKIFMELENSGKREVSTKLIGEMIMNELAEIDQVAYIRFASVYKDFEEAKDFAKFINKISDEQ
jgi:transcriptional repressor NrdR